MAIEVEAAWLIPIVSPKGRVVRVLGKARALPKQVMTGGGERPGPVSAVVINKSNEGLHMNDRSRWSRVVAAAWVLCLALWAIVGCAGSDEPPNRQPEYGELRLPLATTGADGTRYRLRSAKFLISGTEERTVDEDSDDEFRIVELEIGDYMLDLQSGWFMEEQRSDGSYEVVDATLDTPVPVAFEIVADEITDVVLLFTINGEPIKFEFGELRISLEVQKSEFFDYEIDPQLQVEPVELNGQPLAHIGSAAGPPSTFIANEVVIATQSSDELNAFLQKHGGVVLESDAVPDLPQSLVGIVAPMFFEAQRYRVRLDPTNFSLDDFAADAEAAGLLGSVKISTELGAKLLALVANEKALGTEISANFMAEPAVLTATEEHPTAGGFENAFLWHPYSVSGAKTSMTRAWQLIDAAEFPRSKNIAIIDVGFWLDGSGQTMGSTDEFGGPIIQYDFVQGDRFAGGVATCGGNTNCWHGNDSASVATSTLDNQYGAAGTGGQVARPFMFRIDMSFMQIGWAIRTATGWGADVISMSLGAACGDIFCEMAKELTGLHPALRAARDGNVVTVAAAGNDGEAVGGGTPCTGPSVICVGALSNNSNQAIGYSNYGSGVDIFAPTNIPVMPNGANSGVSFATGTSSATPFVAGILATMLAADPTLSAAGAQSLLLSTAWTDSPDSKVTRYVNAFAALSAATGTGLGPSVTLEVLSSSVPLGLPRSPLIARATDAEDATCAGCSFAWSPAPTGGAGATPTFVFDTPGPTLVTVTVTDADGNSQSASATVDVENSPPEAVIDSPAPGSSWAVGAAVSLEGYGLDDNEGRLDDGCTWQSSNPADGFPASGCSLSVSFATAGARTLSLQVTDSHGATSAAQSVMVNIEAEPPPTGPIVTFEPPAPTYTDGYGNDQTLSLSASAVGAVSYNWTVTSYTIGSTTSVYGGPVGLGSSASISWNPLSDTPSLVQITPNSCYVDGQWVRVTVTATNADGIEGPPVSRLMKLYCRLI